MPNLGLNLFGLVAPYLGVYIFLAITLLIVASQAINAVVLMSLSSLVRRYMPYGRIFRGCCPTCGIAVEDARHHSTKVWAVNVVQPHSSHFMPTV